MAIADATELQAPQKVYLFPSNEFTPSTGGRLLNQESALFFQYWPQSLSDDYAVDYAEHSIPGGSHPLYQWSGGSGRTISFEAIFTSELNTLATTGDSILGQAAATAAAASISLLPSSPYTVDVAAALGKIRSWMMPKYSAGGRLGETRPPKILTLVFPNTKLGGSSDLINVILRSAPVTIESWFPNGQIRVATVQLTFSEIVQTPSGGGQASATRVKFIGRDGFENLGNKYKFRGLADRPFVGG